MADAYGATGDRGKREAGPKVRFCQVPLPTGGSAPDPPLAPAVDTPYLLDCFPPWPPRLVPDESL